MSHLSRRNLLRTVISGATMAALPSLSSSSSSQQNTPVRRKGQIRQSASRWCYHSISLEKLCAYGAEIGLKGIDLLNVDEWEVPRRYGLICSMGYAGGGEIPSALNRVENHAKIEEAFRKNIPLAAKSSVPNVITFSGNRAGLSDEEGAKNTIVGLNRLKKIGEDNGVTICMELLNSKVTPLSSDRKSTRLNSSHQIISYAVFCLKKKKQTTKSSTQPSRHFTLEPGFA